MSISRIKPIVAFPWKQFCVVESTCLKIQREFIVAFYGKNVNSNDAMLRYVNIVSFSLYQHHSTNASCSFVIQSMARALRNRSFLVIKSRPTKRIKNVRYEDSFVYMSRIQFLQFNAWVCLLLRSSL